MPLQFNPAGDLTANRVNGETIPIAPSTLATFGLIYLSKGPFFGKDFTLSFLPTGIGAVSVPLVRGDDYDFRFELQGWGAGEDDTDEDKVWGAIAVFEQGLNGTLTVGYQSLGGNWTINQSKIRDYLNTKPFNGAVQHRVLRNDGPLYLPSNTIAEHPLNSIQGITIAQAQLSSITLVVEYILKGGPDLIPKEVDIVSLPLPPNAAKEEGGQLEAISAAQGTDATGVNQLTGGTGIRGWLSGLYSKTSTLAANFATLLTRLSQPHDVRQSDDWNVGLVAGVATVGATFGAPLSVITDSTTTAGYLYVCEAAPGSSDAVAVWRISRMNLTSGRVQWADGVGEFVKIAANRASYTYS